MATTLEMLLALNGGKLPEPAPSMPFPVRTAPPPVTVMPPGPPPEAAPVAPLPPLDLNLISQIAGPAPAAPTARPVSRLAQIGAILSGVSAGLQGRGGEFAAQLREERERPIREYQAALERYQNRRSQGVELATQKQQREQERIQRRADANVEFEREQFLQRTKFKSDEARALAAQAFELEKLREQERVLDERQAAKERADAEKQRRAIENDLATKGGAPPNIAKEISEYQVGLRPSLSPAAEKWRTLQARKAEAQLARVNGGGGGGGQIMAVLQGGAVVPVSLVNKETGAVMLGGQSVPVVQYVGGNIPRQAQTQPTDVKGASPEGFPLALGTPGGPQTGPSDEEVKAYAKRFKISPKKARQELMGQ